MKLLKNQRKTLTWIFFISVVLRLLLSFVPYYFKILNTVSNLSLFLIYAIGSYGIIMFLHNLIQEPIEIYKNKKSIALEIITTIVLVITLGFISFTVSVSAKSNGLYLIDQQLLDNNGNLIYRGALLLNPIMIDEVVQTESTLLIKGREHIEAEDMNYPGVTFNREYEAMMSDVKRVEADAIFEINIEYDEQNNVTLYELKQTILNQASEDTTTHYRYISCYRKVENTYTYNSNDEITTMQSTQTYVEIDKDALTNETNTTLEHYWFSPAELTIHTVIQDITIEETGDNKEINVIETAVLSGETTSTVEGLCTDNTCEYTILEMNEELEEVSTSLSYSLEGEDRLFHSEKLLIQEDEYNYNVFHANKHNQALVESARYGYYDEDFTATTLYGNTYISNDGIFNLRQNVTDMAKTDFGYNVKFYFHRDAVEEEELCFLIMVPQWGRNTNELNLSYIDILNTTDYVELKYLQYTPLYIRD